MSGLISSVSNAVVNCTKAAQNYLNRSMMTMATEFGSGAKYYQEEKSHSIDKVGKQNTSEKQEIFRDLPKLS